jgi:hypothetical protein
LERCPQLKFSESRTLDVDNKFGIQRRKIRERKSGVVGPIESVASR